MDTFNLPGLILSSALIANPPSADTPRDYALPMASLAFHTAMSETGVLDDLTVFDADGIRTNVFTVDVTGKEGFIDLDPSTPENSRKWLLVQTNPSEECSATTVYVSGYGEAFSSMGLAGTALEAMQDFKPGKNVCFVAPFFAGRGTEDSVSGQENLAHISFKDMQAEALANMDFAQEHFSGWFSGDIVSYGHSLGQEYAARIAADLLADGVDVIGSVNASGVKTGFMPAINLPFLANIGVPLVVNTLGKAVNGKGVTVLDDEDFARLMGEPTPETEASRRCSPDEFVGWGLGVRMSSNRAFVELAEENGIHLVTVLADEEALVPHGMTERVFKRAKDSVTIMVPGVSHNLPMELSKEAREALGDAFFFALGGGY